MDFTLQKYDKLCSAISQSITLKEYVAKKPTKCIILRHDVDRSAQNALKMAKIEAKHNLRATYYFRLKTYNQAIIKEIESLGHEIGYHYEVLDEAKGDYTKAKELFKQNLKLFPNCKTVCMHGNPLSKWDNRDFWKKYKLSSFNLTGEAYLSVDFSKITYFTDTGRKWNDPKVSIKDTTNNKLLAIKNTDELIKLLPTLTNAYILTHPERWNDNIYNWSKELVLQNIKNIGKRMLK